MPKINKKYVRKNDCNTILYLAHKYKKIILKNMKFRIRARGAYKNKIQFSKIYKDEQYILLNEYRFHLINCRKCNQIAKAPLSSRRNCFTCLRSKMTEEQHYCLDWNSWGGNAA